jgi:hypothetical protein
VSIEDEASRLRAIASSSDAIPIGMVAHAATLLDGLRAQVMAALPAQSQHADPINGLITAAKESLDHAVGALNEIERAIHNAADGHSRG